MWKGVWASRECSYTWLEFSLTSVFDRFAWHLNGLRAPTSKDSEPCLSSCNVWHLVFCKITCHPLNIQNNLYIIKSRNTPCGFHSPRVKLNIVQHLGTGGSAWLFEKLIHRLISIAVVTWNMVVMKCCGFWERFEHEETIVKNDVRDSSPWEIHVVKFSKHLGSVTNPQFLTLLSTIWVSWWEESV